MELYPNYTFLNLKCLIKFIVCNIMLWVSGMFFFVGKLKNAYVTYFKITWSKGILVVMVFLTWDVGTPSSEKFSKFHETFAIYMCLCEVLLTILKWFMVTRMSKLSWTITKISLLEEEWNMVIKWNRVELRINIARRHRLATRCTLNMKY